MSSDVFISYRWAGGSKDAAARLAAAIQRRLGHRCVSLDVQSYRSGNDLRAQVQDNVKAASVLLVLIHPQWLEEISRLADPDDWVRLEIEAAREFGLHIIPVLVNGAQMPGREQLPESVRVIVDASRFVLAEHATYEAEVDYLAAIIRPNLPGRPLRALERFAGNSAANPALAVAIIGALLLFVSRMLNIHTVHFSTDVATQLGDLKGTAILLREAGVLMAWNWVVVILLVTPLMIFLFNHTLREAKELLHGMQIRRMIFYVGANNETSPMASRGLWETVMRPTARWCQVFLIIALVLGIVQWWQYSGQWLWNDYSREAFLQISTGEDWNVAWRLGMAGLADAAGPITAFALAMYLVYGIGTAITFSYFAFLFNFFSELSSLASSAGSRSSGALKMDLADKDSGGLAAFDGIQRNHARFCYWSLFAMYLMCLRNAYLPPVCRLPEGVADEATMLEHCSSMGGFASNIYHSLVYVIRTVLAGQADFSVLFFTYSQQNHFIVGSLLYAALITSFFYLISWRMTSIIEIARPHGATHLGDRLLRRIRAQNLRTLVLMMLATLATVFLNFGPLVLLLGVLFFMIDRAAGRRS